MKKREKSPMAKRLFQKPILALSSMILVGSLGYSQCPTPEPDDPGDRTWDYFGIQCSNEDETCTNPLQACGPEMIVNGGFEDGVTGFTNDYTLLGNGTNLGTCIGVYTVAESPFSIHSPHWRTRDDITFHQLGAGNSLICDAACDGLPRIAWRQNVSSLSAGVTYQFSAWFANSNPNSTNFVTLLITGADGQGVSVPITTVLVDNPRGFATYGRWRQVCASYTPTTDGAVTLEIQATPGTTGLGGADFSIDEVSFRATGAPDASFSVQRLTTCTNELVNFIPDSPTGIHTWTYDNGLQSNTVTGQTVYATAGTYNVTHTIQLPGSNCTTSETVQVVVDDCSIQDCDPSLNSCGDNLIAYGDFEQISLITSAYSPTNSFSVQCDGRYKIDNSSVPGSQNNGQGTIWDRANDHTLQNGQGRFVIADAPCTTTGAILWQEGVQLTQGVTYNFSCWLSNLSPESSNTPQVLLRINGNPAAPVLQVHRQQEWIEICATFTAPFTGLFPFQLEIGQTVSGVNDSDVGLDDISLFATGLVDASFTNSTEDCAGADITFTSSGTNANAVNHQWDFGDGNQSTVTNPTHQYDLDGTYTVTHTVTDPTTGCTDQQMLTLVINNCCEVTNSFSYTTNTDPDDCSVDFTGTALGTGPTVVTGFSWEYTDPQNQTHSMGNNQNFNYLFPSNGPHYVCFTATGQTGALTCESDVCEEVIADCDILDCDVDANFYAVCDSGTCSPGPFDVKAVAFVQNSFFTPTQQQSNGNFSVSWVIVSDFAVQTFNGPSVALACFTENPQDGRFGIAEVTCQVTYTYGPINNTITCTDTYCALVDLDDDCLLTPIQCQTGMIQGVSDAGMDAQKLQEFGETLLINKTEMTKVTISPNPVSNSANITVETDETTDAVINILDMSGKILKRINLADVSPTNSKQVVWEPDVNVAPGIYMIQVETDFGVNIQRIEITK